MGVNRPLGLADIPAMPPTVRPQEKKEADIAGPARTNQA